MKLLRIAAAAVAVAALALVGITFATASPPGTPGQGASGGYITQASDASWFLFVQVHNDQGTVESAVYPERGQPVSVQHGLVALSNGILTVTGIGNNSWIADGCNCQYRYDASGDLVLSVSTPNGVQPWALAPADVAQYNAGVSALDASQQTDAASIAASRTPCSTSLCL